MTTADIQKHLLDLSERAAALEIRIKRTLERTDRTIALANFCNYISSELRQASRFYPDSTSGLAWVTRNLFETNLIIRYVLISDANFTAWLGQILRDEKDVIDGLLSAPANTQHDSAEARLRARLTESQEIARRHDMEFSKPFRVSDIAKSLDSLEEYNFLYKLFSKYVHPTSLLINSWHQQETDPNWTNIFLHRSQIYTADSIRRIGDSCGFQSNAT